MARVHGVSRERMNFYDFMEIASFWPNSSGGWVGMMVEGYIHLSNTKFVDQINQISQDQQIGRKFFGAIFGGDFRIRTKNNKIKLESGR